VIALAGGLLTVRLATSGAPVDWAALLIGCAASGITAYLCIHVFLKLLERIGMMPFVVYRLVLGAVIFAAYA
jgi:undecaprenyl-diphosphatase